MWSYVQHRRIGHDANKDVSNDEHEPKTTTSHVTDLAKTSSNPDNCHDRILVETSGEDDPFDPRNWPLKHRAKNMIILGILVFTQAWAGAADSMANTVASQEFHVSKVTQSLSTALYLFGIGSGCLFVGTLSETVGRNPTYLVSTFFYILFVLGTALVKTAGGLYVCRYFVGLFASATLGINGASVRDQFRPVKTAFVFPFIAWVNVVRKLSNTHAYLH
jgi:DHA1 family multidrug resistance protein-like MFS transporter